MQDGKTVKAFHVHGDIFSEVPCRLSRISSYHATLQDRDSASLRGLISSSIVAVEQPCAFFKGRLLCSNGRSLPKSSTLLPTAVSYSSYPVQPSAISIPDSGSQQMHWTIRMGTPYCVWSLFHGFPLPSLITARVVSPLSDVSNTVPAQGCGFIRHLA